MADEGEAQGEAPEQEPSQEELLRQLEAEFKQLKVGDVLVQTVFTVSSLGYRSLGAEDRDLEQAKLAIDTMSALTPVLESVVPEELIRDFNQSVASLQLAYAEAAGEGADGDG